MPPRRWNAVVALKGARTCIVHAGRRAPGVTTAATPGLATSGSGDVLAGLIGGLAARGAAPLQAGAWGVLLHARAGDALGRGTGRWATWRASSPAEVPAMIHAIGPRRKPR